MVLTVNDVGETVVSPNGSREVSVGGQARTLRGREDTRVEIRSGGNLTRKLRSFGSAEVSQRERLS